MNGDDRRGEPEWPIRPNGGDDGVDPRPVTRRSESTTIVDRPRKGLAPIGLALGGLLLLLIVLWLFAGTRGSDQDKLTGAESNSAASADPEKACASKQTYDLIKRELFRQAAQVRGSDQAAFDRLSAYAALRMQNPVMETEDSDSGRVTCSGSLALDLPPGVAVAGGRRTLTSDIDYTVQRAADGSGNVVVLRNADAIITPLATLSRVNAAPASPAVNPQQPDATIPPDRPVAPPAIEPPPPPQPRPPAEPRETSSARPSFNCANARTGGERAVCSDAGLASLDRQMAAQFNAARADADPGQRALLERTRGRFLAFRDRCGSDACIADAYRGRMREIRDIMAGRWQPR
jgi:hypothetical protein